VVRPLADAATSPPAPAGLNTVAAFDFDGTLTNGGSVFPFLVDLCGLLPVLRATASLSPALIRSAIVGGPASDTAKEKLFVRLFGGMPEEKLQRKAEAFAHKHLSKHLRDDTRRRLEWHQRQGHYTVIVSASPECYVIPSGHELGVDGVVATRLAVGGGGLLTGGYEGKNCRGAEKYARLTDHLRASGLFDTGTNEVELWAYGNSRGDLRLLGAADHGVDAGQLGPLGRLRKFPRLGDVMRKTELAIEGDAGQAGVAAMPTTSPE
jgi:phosphatidylglycerophosphatase C